MRHIILGGLLVIVCTPFLMAQTATIQQSGADTHKEIEQILRAAGATEG